jgi:prolyl-tRNA synthetase
MYWSHLFIPTLRDNPAEAEVASHRLLLRAGYVRQLSSGIYNYLFLAQRSMHKIMKIIREEMEAIGAQEFHLAALNPAEVWQESGRWTGMGDNMFRLKDRWGRDLCLGMTHEEVMTYIARGELRSYKQLPQLWYQIQTKFRDEPRPKSGLLRVRQFFMKDSYSFDIDAAGLDASYEKHRQAYCKIFERCGIEYLVVEADSGAMGGSASQEFMVATEAGEDYVVHSKKSGYAANLEKAISIATPPSIPDPAGEMAVEEIHTPGKKTIDEVAEFLALPETSQIKSYVAIADYGDKQSAVLALLRGNHQLSETKFNAVLGSKEFRPAHPEEIRQLFGADAGSLGPVGVSNMPVIADLALEGRKNMVCGANKNDYHLKNVTPGKDFTAKFADIRQVALGDTEVGTGAPLEIVKTMEIGHIFKLGYKYSESMGLQVLDKDGKEVTVIMGSYGIGVERVLCAAVELYNDADGISMPAAIAPFEVVVTPVNMGDAGQKKAAEDLYAQLKAFGVDVVLDDRDERPGVKFKDAELVGIPWRVTLGKKLAQGIVEVVERRTKTLTEVALGDVVAFLRGKLQG